MYIPVNVHQLCTVQYIKGHNIPYWQLLLITVLLLLIFYNPTQQPHLCPVTAEWPQIFSPSRTPCVHSRCLGSCRRWMDRWLPCSWSGTGGKLLCSCYRSTARTWRSAVRSNMAMQTDLNIKWSLLASGMQRCCEKLKTSHQAGNVANW